MGDFKYEVDPNFDHIIDEKGNTFIALRKIKWGNSEEAKLDLRKYYSTTDGETMSKGVSFLTEEGPDELVKVLIENEYGDTDEIIKATKNRYDFESALIKNLDKSFVSELGIDTSKVCKEDFYDPKEVLL